jgi:hypothetical protein
MKFPDPDLVDDPRKDSSLYWPYTREQVGNLVGFKAKRAGDIAKKNMAQIMIPWMSYRGRKIHYKNFSKPKDLQYHYELIYQATLLKVQQNLKVKEILLKTKGLTLRSDHKRAPKLPPAYYYEKILMDIRDKI